MMSLFWEWVDKLVIIGGEESHILRRRELIIHNKLLVRQGGSGKNLRNICWKNFHKFFPKMQFFSSIFLGPTNFFHKNTNFFLDIFATHPFFVKIKISLFFLEVIFFHIIPYFSIFFHIFFLEVIFFPRGHTWIYQN